MFAVHPNMHGQSGGGLSLGRGFPIASSTKQKINTRSSTETEVVGVDDFMPAICWTRYFMEAQGYNVMDNIVYQDNMSSILLEKNGKASSGKRTKHIHIRYFFITDRIAKGKLSVSWCPTGDMIRDYMTKPLQGALFRKFRDLIMGVVPTQDPGPGKIARKAIEPPTNKMTSNVSNKNVKMKTETKKKKKKEDLVPTSSRGMQQDQRSVLEKWVKRAGKVKATGCKVTNRENVMTQEIISDINKALERGKRILEGCEEKLTFR